MFSAKNRAKLEEGVHPWSVLQETFIHHVDVLGSLHALATAGPFSTAAQRVLDSTESCLRAQHTTPNTPAPAPYESIAARLRAAARIILTRRFREK